MPLRALILALLILPCLRGYSVLTHEALIDSAWDPSIKPVLLARFPNATAEELKDAHAYAYGGAIVQDLGYYPLGSRFFSDLVHYVRAGDFVENLIAEAKTIDELAFALGALAHDAADNLGHPIGINRAVPLVYPKLKGKFGDRVTYADDPHSHLKVEFGFDVVQVAQGHYAPQAYHDFIGFKVAKELVERSFLSTYGIPLKDVFLSVGLTMGTFRWTVSQLLPEMTKAAWALREDDIRNATPGITRQRFVYTTQRAAFEKEWGHEYKRPGFFARLLAFLFRVIPKVGPFRAFAFRAPGPEAQKYIMESFIKAREQYGTDLGKLRQGESLQLKNENFDIGKPARYGDYKPADKAVDKLVRKLSDEHVEVGVALRTALATFYNGKRSRDRKARAAWAKLQAALGPAVKETR